MNKDRILIFEDNNHLAGFGYCEQPYTDEEVWDKILDYLNKHNGKYIKHIIVTEQEQGNEVQVIGHQNIVNGNGLPCKYRVYMELYWEPIDSAPIRPEAPKNIRL